MNFEEVLPRLKLGYRLQRMSWITDGPAYYLELKFNEIVDKHGYRYKFSSADILANDWIVLVKGD